MRVQLIHPPAHVNATALTALRPAPPLGLAYVAAALRKAGHDVRLLDCLMAAPDRQEPEGTFLRLGLSDDEILERIDPDAAILGITNMWTYAWPSVRPLLRRIKERFPDKTLVCGGEHFTGLAEQSMREAPIDYIVLGEGEQVAIELLARLESGLPFDPAEVAGICWRRGDEIVCNPRATRLRAVDEIEWPARDLFDLDGYNTPMLTHSRWVSDDCNFCEHISSNRLSLYKYWIVANFYLTSWWTHPRRVRRILRNVIREQESSKLESFLIETKRRMLSRARA